jgi:hypothetical protein
MPNRESLPCVTRVEQGHPGGSPGVRLHFLAIGLLRTGLPPEEVTARCLAWNARSPQPFAPGYVAHAVRLQVERNADRPPHQRYGLSHRAAWLHLQPNPVCDSDCPLWRPEYGASVPTPTPTATVVPLRAPTDMPTPLTPEWDEYVRHRQAQRVAEQEAALYRAEHGPTD